MLFIIGSLLVLMFRSDFLNVSSGWGRSCSVKEFLDFRFRNGGGMQGMQKLGRGDLLDPFPFHTFLPVPSW